MAEPPLAWRETRERLRQDARRTRRYQAAKFGYQPATWFLDPGFVCVLLYRLSHLLWRQGRGKGARLFMQLNSLVTGADIQPASDIGPGLLIPTPCGVTISTRAGGNLTALALAGIGGSVRDKDIGAGIGLPLLGDEVTAGQFCGIQGSIRLGDRVVVEAGGGAVVSIADGGRMVPAVDPQPGARQPAGRREASPPEQCGHGSWRRTRADFRADIERYVAEASRYAPPGRRAGRLGALLSNSLLAILVYRLSHWLHLNRRRRLARLLCQSNILLHKLTIPPQSCIGGGLLMPHLSTTVLCGRAGAGLTLYANSLCAPERGALAADMAAAPVIGDEVMVGGHSGVFGAVTVGSRVVLGPKAQLDRDAPDDTQVWSPMARGSERRGAAAAPIAGSRSPAARHQLPPGRAWEETRRRLRLDRERLEPGAPRFPGYVCVRLFRLSHYFHAIGRRRAARWLWLLNAYLTGADVSPACEIGGGLSLPLPAGVALYCRAGERLTVLAASGIGAPLSADGRPRDLAEAPQLGDDVVVSHHSGVYGAVTIGSGVWIMPGCIVARSAPDGVTLVPRRLKFRAGRPAGRQEAV